MNHWPLFGRTPRKACNAVSGDTANPHQHIDCPKCRQFLAVKVDLEQRASSHFSEGSERYRFHTGNAETFATHLAA